MPYQPELIGGHIALDLVNTVSWRLDASRTIDRISTPDALARWCTAVGVAGTGVGRVSEVREAIYSVILPLARGLEPAGLGELQLFLVGALGRASAVAVRPLDWRGVDLPDELLLAAGRLLEREDLTRLRECQDDDCGWLFLDRTKNGSRRWCSSGDCGNRARAKRHYQQLKAGKP
ncbi:CGNR zinc finger domain-containing protein [Kribbella sp. NPDC056861]|uniref:CGNR zinc finger domain-containing protein n=1 Tax=Kribbella sp. NPDC056861 TaxID=3154857 RepID=UPI003414665D